MSTIKDLAGMKFGKLTVLYDTGERKDGRPMWMCICDCGKELPIRSKFLISGVSSTCGCSRIKDISGQRFGKLIVISPTEERKGKGVVFLCKCDCGNFPNISSKALVSGQTTCGKCPLITKNKFYYDPLNDLYVGLTTSNIEFYFDEVYLPLVSKCTWCIHHGYVETFINGKQKSLHRYLMNAEKGITIDHIDGNPLNNLKNNLRVVTQQQNCLNRKPRKNVTSIYKGVSWKSEKKMWQAQIMFKGKAYHMGLFDTEKEAADVYNNKAKELHGEYAKFNSI